MLSEETSHSTGGPIMRNSALNAVAGMAMLATGFVSAVIVARLLGPEANGTVAFAIWLAATGSLVAELGTGISLLRVLPQLRLRGFGEHARMRFAAWLAWPVTVTTLTIAAIYSLVIWLTGGGDWAASAPHLIVITAVLFIVQSVGSFSKNHLVGEQRLGSFVRLSSASAFLQLGAVALGAYFWGISGALLGYMAGQLPLFASTLKILARRPDSCGINVRQFVNSSTIVVIQFIVTAVFLNRPEILFLQQTQAVATVGYYAVALSLANLALQLPIQLTGSLMPYYSSHLEANNGEIPAGVFETVLRSFAYLTFPMSFGLAAVAEPLVTGIYGPAYRDAGSIVAILAVGAPANVFLQLCTQYIFSIDRPSIRLHADIFGAIAMVAGLFAAVPFLGAEGAAIVRNLVLLGMGIYIARFIKLSGRSGSMPFGLVKIVLASLTTAAAAYLATHYVSGLAGVALGIVAGAAVYIPSLRVFKAIDPSDKAELAAIGPKLPAKFRPIYALLLKLSEPETEDATGVGN